METLDALDGALSGEPGALAAPKLGVFRCRVAVGDRVRAGTVLGTLRVLNRGLKERKNIFW